MLEAIVEEDDELMMKYLDGEELSVSEIKKAIRKGTLALHLVPVTCGSSYKNKGVQQLLDAIVDFMPSPVDIPAIKGTLPNGDEAERHLRCRSCIVTDCFPLWYVSYLTPFGLQP